MPVWQWLLESAGVLLLLPLLYGAALIVRRRVLSRNGGTFELSCRLHTAHAGRGWLLGLGRYSGEDLEWFRIFSLSPSPRRVWSRSRLTYAARREAAGPESMSLYAGHVIVECQTPDGPVELAMSEASLTGFASWLEAGPPGADWDRHRSL
ncbi:DUF2550 domain-containing protein [Nocardioides currus]|uniref:DUF2550 domain-containing protein n=1 Tax=Nocardioides currus TaxID=2133958 RepID=A0A2R7YVB7_9ACTN|nr:DUF2550 domain-containing protein [Nocardioides currus]PUA80315.1 DUF2550 domain-containing protein [Nocardioides currus]